jgi:hypothetical protein
MEAKAGSGGSYRFSKWLYGCVCKPSIQASINIFGDVIEI